MCFWQSLKYMQLAYATCNLCLLQENLNTSGHLMLQQWRILRPLTSRLSRSVMQVPDVASNELSATEPTFADRDGTAHSTDSGEGVTPAGPFFDRPAPCLLPESHQASPLTSSENSTPSKACRSSTVRQPASNRTQSPIASNCRSTDL